MAASAAGEENAPEEQAPWFGQPAQAAALPASWEVGPTQPSLALDGASDDMVFVCDGSQVSSFVEDGRLWKMMIGRKKNCDLGDGERKAC